MRSGKGLLGSIAGLAIVGLALTGNGCGGDDSGGTGGSGGTDGGALDGGAKGGSAGLGKGGSGAGPADAAQEVGPDAAQGAGGSNQPDAQGTGGSTPDATPGVGGTAHEGGTGGATPQDSGAGGSSTDAGAGGSAGTGGAGTGGAGTGGSGTGTGGAADAGGGHDGGTGGALDSGLDVFVEAAAPEILCTFDSADGGTSDAGVGTGICNWQAGAQASYGTALLVGTENYTPSAGDAGDGGDAGEPEGAVEFTAHFSQAASATPPGVLRLRQESAGPIPWTGHTTLHAMVKLVAGGSLDRVGLMIRYTPTGGGNKFWEGPITSVGALSTQTWTELKFDFGTTTRPADMGNAALGNANNIGLQFTPTAGDAATWTDATVLVDYVWID